MLLGQWSRPLGRRHRLRLPARVRPVFEMGGVLTRGLDGGLWLFPLDAWAELHKRVSATPFFHPARRQLERLLFGGAQPCRPDSRGAIPISGALREWAGIEGEAVIVGLNDYIEIWSPQRWEIQERAALDLGAEAARQLWGSG